MRHFIAAAAIACLAGTAQAQEAPLNLHLICVGDGVQRRPDVATGSVYSSNGSSTHGFVTTDRSDNFGDEVRIELVGAGGRIRIPQAMLPPVRGGKNGWMDIHDVRATPEEITGVATINLFNKAKIRLDRVTGSLSFTVLKGRFSGRCQAYDPEKVQRAF